MITKGLVANGARVAIASRDEKVLAAAVEEINGDSNDSGGSCYAISANLSTRAGCEQLAADYAAAGESRCDILVNNSGVSWGEPLERESGKLNWGWDRVLDLNVKAPFYLTRAMLSLLRHPSGSAEDVTDLARVINIGSIAGVLPQDVPTHAYDVSKAAIHHLTKKLSADLARPQAAGQRGIAVNAIALGFVPTKMSKGLEAWGADEKVLSASVPLGRCGNVQDVAGAVLYLASPAGSWLTGAIVPIDGGATGARLIPVMPE